MKNNYKELGICKRCKNEKPVNVNGLCINCDDQIDMELTQLYTTKTME
ncbi:hypothetical protein [Guggenheimella bovis]